MFIEGHRFREKFYPTVGKPLSRHDKTQIAVKNGIAGFIKKYASDKRDLLEIGGCSGYQTIIYREQLANPGCTVIYDWKDFRGEEVKDSIEFRSVDLESEKFPHPAESFDVVICNQVLEHIKNIFTPFSEICRILKPGGYLLISVPNLAALHNCLLLALGLQPTTLRILGSHVRGYAIRSMSQFIEMNNHFRIMSMKAFGLHPFTSRPLLWPIHNFCHTPVWLCEKQASTLPTWEAIRREEFTTTSFFTNSK